MSPGASLHHTCSQVTRTPPEQLPQTQKGNDDPTWAENSIPPANAGVPGQSSLGIRPHLAAQPILLLSAWQGGPPPAPTLLADKGVRERNQSALPSKPWLPPSHHEKTLGLTSWRPSDDGSGRKGAGGPEAVRFPTARPGAPLRPTHTGGARSPLLPRLQP